MGGVAAVVGVPLLLAGAIGGAAYYGFSLVLAPTRIVERRDAPPDANAVLEEAMARVRALRQIANSLPPRLAREAKGIADIAVKIVADIAEQPQKLDSGRRFLTHYLDSTQRVLDYYHRLRSRQSVQLTDEVDAKVASVLGSVRSSFERQRESLMADEMLKLSTELDVLQQTVQLEGDGSRST